MGTMDEEKMMMLIDELLAEYDTFDELEKLGSMLTMAGIPFENFGTQICYYGPEGRPEPESNTIWQGRGIGAVCSVIANGYGSEEGLLEISGLMTEEEMKRVNDTVLGHLTAEDVFTRIREHYESVR